MPYCVIAYPNISQADFDWIQDYRQKNDRYFSIVKPHFTFVFPVSDFSQEDFVAEIKTQAAGAEKFDFEIKVATITLDRFVGCYHEFLVPDKGYSNIVKLHDQLYDDKLISERRLDLNFIPHIGIGNSDDPQECKHRVNCLNRQSLDIKGTVDTLDIVEYKRGTGEPVETIERICLG